MVYIDISNNTERSGKHTLLKIDVSKYFWLTQTIELMTWRTKNYIINYANVFPIPIVSD